MNAGRMCSGCLKVLPLVAFLKNGSRCRACRAEKRRQWRERPLPELGPSGAGKQSRAATVAEQRSAGVTCDCCGDSPKKTPLLPWTDPLWSEPLCWRCRLVFKVVGGRSAPLKRMADWLAGTCF